MVIGYAILILGILGLISGAGLAFASKKFAVEVDPKQEAILEVLPGANCGACGLAGCSAYADAIVKGTVEINLCSPGGESVVNAIGDIMGLKVDAKEPEKAFILCCGDSKKAKDKMDYRGLPDCTAANLYFSGAKACEYGCMGFGTCVSVCPFNAIIQKNDSTIPYIDLEKCTGCGKCVSACPKNIIILKKLSSQVTIKCSSIAKGKEVRSVCEVGCIGCGICKKKCPVDAITVENFLAKIDVEKCINCGICVSACPRKTIETKKDKNYKAKIKDGCIGCTICAKKCPVDAVTGEKKQVHKIDPEKCVGCGICAEKCPKKVIEMVEVS